MADYSSMYSVDPEVTEILSYRDILKVTYGSSMAYAGSTVHYKPLGVQLSLNPERHFMHNLARSFLVFQVHLTCYVHRSVRETSMLHSCLAHNVSFCIMK
jgi:hypothetical protein